MYKSSLPDFAASLESRSGLLAGVELLANHGRECARLAEEDGLIVRAIGDTIAFCPPLIISEAEIQELLARFTKALNRL